MFDESSGRDLCVGLKIAFKSLFTKCKLKLVLGWKNYYNTKKSPDKSGDCERLEGHLLISSHTQYFHSFMYHLII